MIARNDLKWLLPLAAVCLAVFANSLGGEFVYDDTRQIVRNILIQDNSLIWKALTSDVWAFKGDGSVAASNYWRPTFTLWNIVCFRLFGMNPVGWHVANVLLHTGVCIHAFSLLRRWMFPAAVAFAIALIFAVHPVHVESVAWIAGSPDLLFSLAFLGSLWFATSYRESRSGKHLALILALYAVALGAKEVGILCLPIYYFVLAEGGTGERKPGANNSPLLMLGAVAVVYFLLRLAVLGAVSRPPDDPPAFVNAILSVPSMFVFYLRQIIAPVWIAANYPLEPVSQIGATNFILPLAVSFAALAAAWYLARTSRRSWLAAALFLLPLVPAMNAVMFPSEHLVHDRYLYLPLLGVLMLIVPFAARWLSERNVVIACVVISTIFAFQTVRYNSAWANELALWSWTAAQDDSAFTAMQYGSALAEADKHNESVRAYSAAITKRPRFRGYLGRARSYIALKQYANAEKDLAAAFALPKEQREAYAVYQAYEALGIAYSEQRKLDAAAKNFRDARTELPMYAAALTEKLAVVLYQAGQKDEALRELEGAKAQARRELLPESKTVFLRLGMLYAELGRKDEARAHLREYLDLTASVKDQLTTGDRNSAAQLLRELK